MGLGKRLFYGGWLIQFLNFKGGACSRGAVKDEKVLIRISTVNIGVGIYKIIVYIVLRRE